MKDLFVVLVVWVFLPGFSSSKCQVKPHLITYFTQVTEVPAGKNKQTKLSKYGITYIFIIILP